MGRWVCWLPVPVNITGQFEHQFGHMALCADIWGKSVHKFNKDSMILQYIDGIPALSMVSLLLSLILSEGSLHITVLDKTKLAPLAKRQKSVGWLDRELAAHMRKNKLGLDWKHIWRQLRLLKMSISDNEVCRTMKQLTWNWEVISSHAQQVRVSRTSLVATTRGHLGHPLCQQ